MGGEQTNSDSQAYRSRDSDDESDLPAVTRRSLLGGLAIGAAGAIATESDPDLLIGAASASEEGGGHSAVMNLVPTAEATHTATTSGAWSAASTWDNGRPGDGARVHVPEGTTVTVDGEFGARLDWVRVDGTLRFATDTDTHLTVETIVTTEGSRFEIGTESDPVQADVTAQITFIDTGEIDDPERVSRGLLTMGTVRTKGQTTSPFHELATGPTAGDASLELAEAPTGWEAGDTVVVPSCSQEEVHRLMDFDHPGGKYQDGDYSRFTTQDEERTITGVSGTSVELDEPLEYDHVPPKDDLPVHAANFDRNIRFESENDATKRRGHIMFMSQDVKLCDVELDDLGRTDKTRPFSNPVVGSTETEDNPKARYSCHFHQTGLDDDGPGVDTSRDPGVVEGCAVRGSPGWGIVNHDSYVEVSDCASYEVRGAHYVCEAGWEEGSFTNCIAIRSRGSGGREAARSRREVGDFGHAGFGFWLGGLGVPIENTVATGCWQAGYSWPLTHVIQERHLDDYQNNDDYSDEAPAFEINAFRTPLSEPDPKSETTELHHGDPIDIMWKKMPDCKNAVAYETKNVGKTNHYSYRITQQKPLADMTTFESITGYNIHKDPDSFSRGVFPMFNSWQIRFKDLYLYPNNDKPESAFETVLNPDGNGVYEDIHYEGNIKLVASHGNATRPGQFWGQNIDVPQFVAKMPCRVENLDADTVVGEDKIVSFGSRSVARAEAETADLTDESAFSVVENEAASGGKALRFDVEGGLKGGAIPDERATVSVEDVPDGDYRVFVRYRGYDFSAPGFRKGARLNCYLDPEGSASEVTDDVDEWLSITPPTRAGASRKGRSDGNVVNLAWGGTTETVSLEGGDHELVLANRQGVDAVDSVLLVEHSEDDPEWTHLSGPRWPADVEERIANGGSPVEPSVSMADQTSDGQTVSVDSAANPKDFAVVVHQGSQSGPKIGSTTVPAGTNSDVQVPLDEALQAGEHTLVPMLHEAADSGHGPPIFHDGEMVTDSATVTVEGGGNCVVEHFAGEDGDVSDIEVLRAIRQWREDETVPGCGREVSYADLLELIARWRGK